MNREDYTAKKLIAQAPWFFAIVRQTESMDELRKRLAEAILARRDHALENYDRKGRGMAIRIHECAQILSTMFRRRAERLSDFSITRAIRDLAQGRSRPDLQAPFYADLMHLLWGLDGHLGFDSPADVVTSPTEKTGRAAARERSHQLDRLSGLLDAGIARFPSGLDPEVVARREARRRRILSVLGGSPADWDDWH